MKKVICINDSGWITDKRFLFFKWHAEVWGPTYGNILSVSKENDGSYWFHECGDESYNKSQFVQLTEEEVAAIEQKRKKEFT